MMRRTMAMTAAVLLLGCSSLSFKTTPEGNQRAENLADAGSVHVAVLAVTPWDEIKSKLRPNLQIDHKTLREQSIPITFSMLDKYLDILRLQVALAPTTVKTSTSSTTVTETGKEDATKTQSTTATAPGEARSTSAGAALAAGAAPAATASAVSAINSSLTARAMASFVQDVQALNAEVDSAAKRTGYTPYLMRIQVSVMPRRRHLGYDVYSNLSFFGYSGSFDSASGDAGRRVSTNGTPFIVPLLSSDSIETAQRSQSIEALRDVGIALDLIKGFGSAGAAFGSQTDRQQALQGLDVNSVLTLGRLSDNTLRVRLGAAFDPGGGFAVHPRTNTISVLVFFPTQAHQSRIVSRNSWVHVIDGTSLDQTDESYDKRLQPIASQWRNLGMTVDRLKEIDELPLEGNYEDFEKQMDVTLQEYCKSRENPTLFADPRKVCVSAAKGGANTTHRLFMAGKDSERERAYSYIWSHLLSILPGSRFSTTVVDLPTPNPQCPLGSQLAAYMEDEKGVSVALRGGAELAASKLQAAMHWAYLPALEAQPSPAAAARGGRAAVKGNVKGAVAAQRIAAMLPSSRSLSALMASDVSVSEDGKVATMAFSSSRIEPLPGADAARMTPVAVEIHGCKPNQQTSAQLPGFVPLWADGTKRQWYLLNARIPKKEKDDAADKGAGMTLSTSALSLVLDKKNSARTTVTVDLGEKPKTAFALTAVGAVIQAAAPADSVTRRKDGGYSVGASGPVDLTFINLLPNQSVDLELRPVDEKDKLGAPVKRLTLVARSAKG